MGPSDYKYGILENGRMPYGWQPFAVRTGKKFKDRFFKKEGGAKEYYDVFGRKIENGSEVTEICQRWLLEDLEENLMIEMMRKNSVSCKTLREEAL